MTITNKRGFNYWLIQGPGWTLLTYLVFAQGITALSYDFGVSMGTQESQKVITEVGAAFWYGFALGDLLTYIPILFLGLIGHLRERPWGRIALSAALGITLYWPIVCLVAMVDARDAIGWNIESETPYWIVCLLVASWGGWSLWTLLRDPTCGST